LNTFEYIVGYTVIEITYKLRVVETYGIQI
jgi:hypothetical protein